MVHSALIGGCLEHLEHALASAINRAEAAELEVQRLEETNDNNRAHAAELEVQRLKAASAINRVEAAELEVEQLKAQLHAVEVFDVDTDQTEQIVRRDVEPAPKRLKRLQEGSSELQAQATKAQVRVKQEKAEVAEDLEDTQDNYQTQITFTDTLQTKLDEMAKLALANGAKLCEVNKIKRPA